MVLNQFEDMIIDTLVQKLNAQGINVNAETVKKAVANSPQIVQQIESILLASSSQDRLQKIKTLITQAAQQGSSTTTGTKTDTTK